MSMDALLEVRLRVSEAESRDVGRSLVRMDIVTMRKLGAKPGDIVQIEGERQAVGKGASLSKRGACETTNSDRWLASRVCRLWCRHLREC
jgi:hypothetical protein